MVKCPWCGSEEVKKDYSGHLQSHYKSVDGETTGPYTVVEADEGG